MPKISKKELEQLYLDQRPKAMNKLFGLYLSPADAEQVYHQTFLSLLISDGYDLRKGNLESYFYGTLRNKAIDQLTRRKREILVGDIYYDANFRWLTAPEAGPDQRILEEVIDRFKSAKKSKSRKRHARILHGFYVQGLSHEEISQREGITLSNSGTLLNRARNHLLDFYQEDLLPENSSLH